VIKRVSAMPTKQKEKQKKKKKSSKKEENKTIIVNNIQLPKNEAPEVRTINLYGDITEKVGAEVVSSLLYLQSTSMVEIMPEDPEDPENTPVTLARSIEIYLSTHGGTASDMFSIIDVMESIKKNTCDIETLGIGKVMSAGVPILAAGTPGKRKIGKNCRVMLHSVMAGTGGTIFSMENELEEIKWIQDSYIKCLAGYTKMTPARIRKILKTQKDSYFSAQEAIKMGIADEII
tara:strand:+ start:317 stop:1015 length:699 start_codon:yes stop_codon:yes gene_type:complete